MFLVEGSSETGFFRHLSKNVFGIRNFGNTKGLRVIFCFKMFKIYTRFQKSSIKLRKKFFVSGIIASELVSLNSLY